MSSLSWKTFDCVSGRPRAEINRAVTDLSDQYIQRRTNHIYSLDPEKSIMQLFFFLRGEGRWCVIFVVFAYMNILRRTGEVPEHLERGICFDVQRRFYRGN